MKVVSQSTELLLVAHSRRHHGHHFCRYIPEKWEVVVFDHLKHIQQCYCLFRTPPLSF